jgi:polysaccharide biosynthesis/export protein
MHGTSLIRGLNKVIGWKCGWLPLLAAAVAIFPCAASTSFAQEPSGRAAASTGTEVQRLKEGDVVRITFPGAPNLDMTQQIRRDGRINLFIIGEMEVAGLTPTELEQELLKRYEGQLMSKEVIVSIVSSSFSVLVNGAVLRPGKVVADRPLSILEAIMEAGGFAPGTAKTKAVVVMRTEEGRIKRITLDLKKVLEGRDDEAYFLQPNDIVYVPTRFTLF